MKQVLYSLANLLNEMNGKQDAQTMTRIRQDLLIAVNSASGPKVRATADMLTLLADMMPNA